MANEINRTRTQNILRFMTVLTWIGVIGVMIEAGTILTTYIVSCVNPGIAPKLYLWKEIEGVMNYDFRHYTAAVSLHLGVLVMKSLVLFQLIKILSKVNLVNPFTTEMAKALHHISYFLAAAWFIAVMQNMEQEWLLKHVQVRIGEIASDQYLFMAGIVFIISQVFQRGIELQAENDLTV